LKNVKRKLPLTNQDEVQSRSIEAVVVIEGVPTLAVLNEVAVAHGHDLAQDHRVPTRKNTHRLRNPSKEDRSRRLIFQYHQQLISNNVLTLQIKDINCYIKWAILAVV